MDWAKHRRRKAAAKCHMLLDAQTFLPRFAVVKSAKSSDSVQGRVLCNQLRDGEIVVFDKASTFAMQMSVPTEKKNSEIFFFSRGICRFQTSFFSFIVYMSKGTFE
jgi:hypothetical protein